MVRIFAGITTSILGLFGWIFGWMASVVTAPTVAVKSCTGVWAATVCDSTVHNLTSWHIFGVVGSILGGILVIAIGIVIACWHNIK